jgi:hypothetical protein
MSEIIKPVILRESFDSVKPLYEAETNLKGDKVKMLKLYGTAIVCDKTGINGRAYPSTIISRESKNYTNKYIRGGRNGAELNHPRLTAQGEGKDYSVFEINLAKVCCLIESLEMKGKELKCKMRVVERHPAGQMLASLCEAGYHPGYSLRGAGSVIEVRKNYFEVADDYRMITVDVVGNPSFDDAAITEVVFEAVRGGKIQLLTEAVDLAAQEFIGSVEKNSKILISRDVYNRVALESFTRTLATQKLFG